MSAVQLSRLEVADIIERFLLCTGGKWDWDDFCSFAIADPYLDSIRTQCCDLCETHPPDKKPLLQRGRLRNHAPDRHRAASALTEER